MKRNAKEQADFGFEFGTLKLCFSAPHQGGLVCESYNFLPQQGVCLSFKSAAQFLFDKHTVKDLRIKLEILYKNKSGKKKVDFFFLWDLKFLRYP